MTRVCDQASTHFSLTFFGKYARDFGFENLETFGDINPPLKRKINFINMTSDAIEAQSEDELSEALIGRSVDVTVSTAVSG